MMSKATATFETEEEFLAAELSDIHAMRDGSGDVWLIWENEDGDWYAVRPRNEDDPEGGDVVRPIGPTPVGAVPFPVAVIDVHKALPKEDTMATRLHYPDEYELSDAYAGIAEDVGGKSYDEAYADAERGLNDLLKCAWAQGLASAEYDHEAGRIVADTPNPYRIEGES